MVIRNYQASDCEASAQLFYETVHTVNLGDYTKEQVDVWAPEGRDLEQWNQSLLAHYSVVAVDGESIVGFGDIAETGYLDRLFVHKEHQREGIASALCEELERAAGGKIVVHASTTAKPFFESRGYRVVRKQQVEKDGIFFTNYVMEK